LYWYYEVREVGDAFTCCDRAAYAAATAAAWILKLPNSWMAHSKKAGWTIQVYAPGAPGGKTVMIYHNKKKWFGSAQYRNGVIHKIFINVLGRPRLVWYNKTVN
jgi:hypothetical protein